MGCPGRCKACCLLAAMGSPRYRGRHAGRSALDAVVAAGSGDAFSASRGPVDLKRAREKGPWAAVARITRLRLRSSFPVFTLRSMARTTEPAATSGHLQAVCENATAALFVMDDQQHCVYMNASAELLTGYRLAEVQGQALHNFVHHTHPDGRPYPLADCPIDRAAAQNLQEQGEEVFVHKEGPFYPWHSRPARSAAMARCSARSSKCVS